MVTFKFFETPDASQDYVTFKSQTANVQEQSTLVPVWLNMDLFFSLYATFIAINLKLWLLATLKKSMSTDERFKNGNFGQAPVLANLTIAITQGANRSNSRTNFKVNCNL